MCAVDRQWLTFLSAQIKGCVLVAEEDPSG